MGGDDLPAAVCCSETTIEAGVSFHQRQVLASWLIILVVFQVLWLLGPSYISGSTNTSISTIISTSTSTTSDAATAAVVTAFRGRSVRMLGLFR